MRDSTSQPKIIDSLFRCVHQAHAVLAGMQLDLFTPLKDGPMNAEQIADVLGVTPPKLRPLLHALVATGLLTMEEGLFANTVEADQFLVRDHPDYLGEGIAWWSHAWNATLKTAESIRTGIPQVPHDSGAMPKNALEAFLSGIHSGAVAFARELAASDDFSSCRTLLDAGGGTGGLAITLTKVYPYLQATVVDLPVVTPLTQRFVAEAGAADRVRVVAADLVQGALTDSFDVAVLRTLLTVLSPEQARQALRHIGQSINPGGRIYIEGPILDNSHLSPLGSVMLNLVFLNFYEGGRAHTEQEHREWLSEAGFESIERRGPRLMTAQKQL